MVCGSVVGLFTGWAVNDSRYGKVAMFGPFSLDNSVEATNVSAAMKAKTQLGAPRIEVVGGEEFDFGVMEPGAKGEHKFVVKNVGEFPMTLEIASVGTSRRGVFGMGIQCPD